MVLLNHVVEISPFTHFHLPRAGIFLTKQLQTSEACLIAIDVDFLRPWDSSIGDDRSEKCLRGLFIAILAEQRPNKFSVHRARWSQLKSDDTDRSCRVLWAWSCACPLIGGHEY